jgi:hypothetical protein
VGAQCRSGLDISLYAGPAGGVQTGNDQHLGALMKFDGVPPQKGLTTARMTTIIRTSTGNSLNQR